MSGISDLSLPQRNSLSPSEEFKWETLKSFAFGVLAQMWILLGEGWKHTAIVLLERVQ